MAKWKQNFKKVCVWNTNISIQIFYSVNCWSTFVIITSLIKALLPGLLSLVRQPALVSPGCAKLLLFENFSPDLCLAIVLTLSSVGSSFDLMDLVLQYTLSAKSPSTEHCVPLQIMPNQLNIPQVDLNCVVAEGRSTYANVIFQYFFFHIITNILKI